MPGTHCITSTRPAVVRSVGNLLASTAEAKAALRDHESIPGSRLVVRKNCGHGSRWRLETFLSEIEAFLDDVEGGRPVAGRRVV